MILRIAILAAVLIGLELANAASADAAPLELLYQDRPPYYVTNPDGTVGGVVTGRVTRALNHAGIDYVWKVRPGKRQLETVKRGRTAVCSPGWFKKPEREIFAKFSDVVYRDKPQIVVVRSADRGKFRHPSLAGLLGSRELRFGKKLGYSYGRFIDDLVADISPNTIETPQDVVGMTRMLLGNRFDYFVAAPEEFDSLVKGLGVKGADINAVQFVDIPAGNRRYLMCSKLVDDALIQRFNEALKTLDP